MRVTNTSFIDLLFNLLLGFVVLFILSFLMIRPPVPPAIKPPAEIIITVDWPWEYNDDIDVWVRDPQDNIVWYLNKQAGFMSIDRDDLGSSSDEINGISLKLNREIVLIRGIIPGEYVVNIYGYKRKDPRSKTPVTVEVTKLSPYQIIDISTVEISEGEEITTIRFTLDETGKLVSKSKEYRPLVIRGRPQ